MFKDSCKNQIEKLRVEDLYAVGALVVSQSWHLEILFTFVAYLKYM